MTTHRWHAQTAWLVAMGITSIALPLLATTTVIAQPELQIAQLFQQQPSVGIRAGTQIPVRYDEAEKIIVTPEETAPLTLTVSQDIRSARGTVLITAGSKIVGELRPDDGGTRFFSEAVIPVNRDSRMPIDATSNTITETETITRDTNPDLLRGAAIGAAAGAILGEIFGSIDFLEVLGGAGAGVLASVLLPSNEEVEVVVINPSSDLDLTLQSDFVLR